MQSAMRPKRATGTVLVVLGLAATLLALLLPVYWFDGNRTIAITRSGWQDDGDGTWKTKYGPVTPLDRDFIRKVRAATLWELPAGRVVRERATRKSVRTVGAHLLEGDTKLDEQAVKTARTLGVRLPNRPPDAQQRYLDDLKKARGASFDRIAVNRLRKQNGVDFALVSLVRDQTRNSLVRSLATRSNTVLLDHLYVEEESWARRRDALNGHSG